MTEFDPNALARHVAALVSEQVRDQMTAHLSEFDQQRSMMVEAVRSEAAQMSSRHESRLQDVVTQAVATFQQSSENTANSIAQRFATGSQNVAEQATRIITDAGSAASSQMNAAAQQVAQQAAELHEAARHAIEAQRVASEKQTAAEQAQREADEARVKAEKAAAFLTLAGDAEIRRLEAEKELTRKERETVAALKEERRTVEDRLDRQDEHLRRGAMQFYPELQAELDRLMSEDNEDEQGE